MNKVLVNNQTFNLKSKITDNWGGSHRVAIDLKALSSVENWKIEVSLPKDYKILKTYRAELIREGGKTYLTGKGHNNSFDKGDTTEIILIVDEGKSGNLDPIKPQFVFADSKPANPINSNSSDLKPADPINSNSSDSNSDLDVDSSISADWYGGYKLEVDIKAESKADNWSLDFQFPHKIRASYGVDLINHGNNKYTINGQNNQVNLNQGQSIKPIFIIDDNGQKAVFPEFDQSVTVKTPTPVIDPVSKPVSKPVTAPISTPEPAPAPAPTPASSPDPVNIPDNQGKSVGQQGKFAYGEALQKNFLFLEANRSGDLGKDNRLEWRSDSTTKDGSRVGRDLEGGYFDAGDHVKFGQPMAASVNMLAWGGIEYTAAYKQSGQFDELLDAVKWGTDYFLKAHETSGGKTSKLWVQVGEGGGANDHGYWGTPESVEKRTTRNAFYIDASRPGSDVAASTSSALAAASMLFRGVDNAYADKLLKNAKQLYDFAETYQGKYSDSVRQASPFYTSWSGYGDELASGAAWLYKASREKSYLSKAENHFKSKVGGLGDWSWAVDDHSYGAAVILAQESNDSFFKGQVEGWLNRWVNGGGNIKYTKGGFAHRATWGSVPVTSSAAYLAQLYNDTVKQDSRYTKFANKQVDYILGDNPANLSYMVGFGDKYPQSPHHRGSAPNLGGSAHAPMENILYGAVVGGPDSANDFSHNDSRHDWVTNEVGTSYNAPFASALIQQYDNLGGDPLSFAELDALPGVDANGVGF